MRFKGGPGWTLVVLPVVCAAAAPVPVAAQGVRGELTAVGSYVEYRTTERVAIPEDQVPGEGLVRRLEDGTVVTCVPGGDCYYYRAGDMEEATPVTQELRLTAWPGERGIFGRARVRGRFGSDDFWPKSEEELEVLALNADFERPSFRVRAGRQERTGGLGLHYFDGGAVLWRGWHPLRVEAFGGRSLARTLVQSYSGDLLEESDFLAPEEPADIWGVEGKLRLGRGCSGALLYQREIRSDRDGLYSERVSADARLEGGRVAAELSGDLDIAAMEFTDARARLTGAASPRLNLAAEGRYYRPFFPLWTIWGVFSPVGYGEGKLSANWTAAPGLTLRGGAAWRDYAETDAATDLAPVEGDGWRAFGGGAWLHRAWMLALDASVHRGYGAARTSVEASAGRNLGSGYVGLYGQATEQFTEFRFGEGNSIGAGLEGWWTVGAARLDGSVAWYSHRFEDRPGYDDYEQIRGRLGVTLAFGTEPQAVTRIAKGGRS